MCRMIAAVGTLDPRLLLDAVRRVAANDNPAHTHERRRLGKAFRHEDGWGAAWVEMETLQVVRRPDSILTDAEADRRLTPLRTPLLLIHARRASRGVRRIENTHPFTAQYLGRTWAFCHNGTIEDRTPLRRLPGLSAGGGTDSERLFHHFLNCIAARYEGDLGAATSLGVLEALSLLTEFTAAHSFLATTERIVAAAARHPTRSQPGYHSLWEGCGPDLHVVSSEPVDGLGCAWSRIPEPGVVTLEVFR